MSYDTRMPSDEELLLRAVSCVKPFRGEHGSPRWSAVMDTFQIGSTYASALCQRFDLDPEEKVWR